MKENEFDSSEKMRKLLEKPPSEEYVTFIQSVQNCMRKMKTPGVGVLSKVSLQDLTNANVFSEAVQELIFNCEFLFDILNAA